MAEPQKQTDPSIALKFPEGINNRARETSLPEGSLRECTNLDVTNEGTLRVRDGLRQLMTGAWHSLYPHPHGAYLCAVKDGSLGVVKNSEFISLTPVVGPVRYADFNGDVFWSDGDSQGRIDGSGGLVVWGLNPPPQLQVVVVSDQGGLDAGDYQITYTASVNGLESGAPYPVQVKVPAGGGIQVTTPVSSARFSIYLTPPNGQSLEFTKVADLSGGVITVVGSGQRGKNLESLGAVKPPPSDHLCAYKGRLWAATGTTVWFTDTLSPHWLFPENGYFLFDAPVTLLEAAEDGLYIAAGERTYFLQGTELDKMNLRPVLYNGAVPGSGLGEFPYYVLIDSQGMIPTRSCAWLSTDGVFCVGRAGGMVSRVTDKSVSLSAGLRGLSAYWQHDGLRTFLLATDNQEQVVNAARDRSVAVLFQNGVSLGP